MSNHFDDPKNVRLLIRLGIITPDTDVADVFLAWGRFIGDPAIRFAPGSLSAYVDRLTSEDKIALRDRVAGVAQFPVRQS